ncbi:GyrI-like domain-containing protein [Actinotalea sp. M2MS4P-6]|uniref:GyrI-like domain-containing protein n=1 Tax=Actinotalea sp. M2MS4P-6 TaxID=2983762 RepID=UPI0021E3DC72|nr:GyrI-like domain-containing protein [Actinotalea sp. M2MS4P-6]MCV2396278.1 GyrI-like domain-containing protein [Actinotalea sp. M2MS4P-6]
MEIVEVPQQLLAVITGEVPAPELPAFFDRAFHELGELISAGQLEPVGPPLARYPSMPTDTVLVEVGFPVAAPTTSERVESRVLDACRAAHTVHRGDYAGLADAWQALMEWSAERGLSPRGPFWEVYVTDPSQGEPVTELYQPVG